jgi:hypothetical protein
MREIPESPGTCAGVVRLVVSPTPSCPNEFTPQVQTVLSERKASAWPEPVPMRNTPLTVVCTGEMLFDVLLLPSWPVEFAPQA